MKKILVPMLLAIIAISINARAAKTVEDVIIAQKSGNYHITVLYSFENGTQITYRAPIKLTEKDLKALGIPADAWTDIMSKGDLVFSLKSYYLQKDLEAKNMELEKMRAVGKQSAICFGGTILILMAILALLRYKKFKTLCIN